MDAHKIEPPKLSDMVMCGDHPSFTKTVLNVKEERMDDKPIEEKPKAPKTYSRISPTAKDQAERTKLCIVCPQSSRTERANVDRVRPSISEHALRLLEARRRARSLEVVSRQDDATATGNRALVQAALGSFRWPPYLVAVWVLVLLLTHLLHCIVSLLERSLPALKKFCNYFRTWAEETWKSDMTVNHRVFPLALACITGLLYALYFGLYAAYSVALWSIEPLCAEEEKREDTETKVTEYEEVSKTTSKE